MSGTRSQIESFFRTLLLGDFEEEQNTAAQIVGGLISMVPVLDQVMDARDITGSLFRINQRGGFDKASSDQLVNLGFSAFGAVPMVGSAFKTVFKPLWRERHAAKGAVNGGLQAMERMLGMNKGGAIRWVQQELLGKWAQRSNAAIQQVDLAMASCIELMEFMATAQGWKNWLIPDSVQQLARELLPGMKAMRSQIKAPLQRASNEIRMFLEDLLGEQAAAVMMAAGERAVAGSAMPGSRARTGHNAADTRPRGHETPRQPERKVAGRAETDAGKGKGPAHAAVRLTRKAFADLANQEKGLIGEHMADYHELKRLGGGWPHDQPQGAWSPTNVQKLNVDKRPVNLSLLDLPKVNHAGIDAVWQHDGSYTVTEAKARESIAAAYGLGKFLTSQGKIIRVTGLNPDQELLHYLLSDSSDKRGTEFRMVQMSVDWVRERAEREGLSAQATAALQKAKNRRVLLVTFESEGALDHVQALTDIHQLNKPIAEFHPHHSHGITREWHAADIDVVVKARDRVREDKKKLNEAPATSKKGTRTTSPKRG
ncbi:MAG: hypothetical protein LBE51_20875 [Acidovorax sp.]|jgi:hypothetical protein|nr:hypothetical protein [Acidovorax sp.]